MTDWRAAWVPEPPPGWEAAGGDYINGADPGEETASDEPETEPRSDEPQPKADEDALLIDADTWEPAETPRRPWVAPGYALRGAVTLVAGPPSALKSSLMLGWATSIALCWKFGRFHPAEPGKTIIYNVEDDGPEQRRRLEATLRQFDASPADIAGKVIRVAPRTVGTLIVRDENGRLHFTPAMEQLDKLIAKHRPAMFIADPFTELHNSEENDNTAIRSIVAKFRELAITYNMAVIILHHTRKGAAYSPGDPDIARGASAIIGAVRIAVTLTLMSEDDAKAFGLPTDIEQRSNFVRLDDAKSNYAPLRSAQWFEKVPYTLANGEVVPAAVPWTPPEAKVASLQDLTVLAAAVSCGCPESNGEPWSPKLSKDKRSIRTLLERHGFTCAEAQRPVLDKLERDLGMEAAGYRRPSSRAPARGYRIDGRPAAAWEDEDE